MLKKICEIIIVEGYTRYNFLITKMLREIQFQVTSKNEARKTPNVTVAKKICEIVILKGDSKRNFIAAKKRRKGTFFSTKVFDQSDFMNRFESDDCLVEEIRNSFFNESL